ncbi:FitA-like ribbon-helix-helix domain-containing protein [Thiothrix nivea]|uniref:Antitoxin FitA-like ribbon-helix-helix domain-containing protein n=1 Tax=Thiothrix nivea (strain ATCC 35100 / DSM 5205 / JP2) TaxID=870187 RepID=A0A656HEK8_THINJ|nr:hypothetical protein [Thiothrix nivea]EIJ34803.1 hypothetical protein Thini_2241 [Thiothrix nivea DSM 5205]
MASLSIRKLEDETLQRLRIRAAHHQVSMEEEARRILRQAVMPPARLGSLAAVYFGEEGVDLELPQREIYEPMSFDA